MLLGRERGEIIFCNFYLKEIELENCSKTYFKEEDSYNIIKNIGERIEREYNRTQFKNKRDLLKKDWKLWKELKYRSTRLGWDPSKKTVDVLMIGGKKSYK